MAHLESDRERRSPELAASGIKTPSRWRVPALYAWLSPLLLVLLILVWQAAVDNRLLSPVLFAPPTLIARTILESVQSGELLRAVGATLLRVGLGLLLGGSAAVLLGLLMGWSRAARDLIDPWVAGVYAMPKIALLPLLIFFLGIGEEPLIFLAALAAFFPLLINTMAGVGQINPIHFQVAENYGARLPQLFTRVILPGSLPSILSGLRIAFNTCFLVTIAAEMVSARIGLGYRIWSAWQTLLPEQLWSSLVVICLIGIVSNLILRELTRRMIPWQASRAR